jgi:hypothetical protein
MKITVNKFAFIDKNTGEYFKEITHIGELYFTNDLSKAKLYILKNGINGEVNELFYLLKIKRPLIQLVSINLTFEDIGHSDLFEQYYKKIKDEYVILDQKVQIDIDSMSEKDYKRYRYLKLRLSEL